MAVFTGKGKTDDGVEAEDDQRYVSKAAKAKPFQVPGNGNQCEQSPQSDL